MTIIGPWTFLQKETPIYTDIRYAEILLFCLTIFHYQSVFRQCFEFSAMFYTLVSIETEICHVKNT